MNALQQMLARLAQMAPDNPMGGAVAQALPQSKRLTQAAAPFRGGSGEDVVKSLGNAAVNPSALIQELAQATPMQGMKAMAPGISDALRGGGGSDIQRQLMDLIIKRRMAGTPKTYNPLPYGPNNIGGSI